MGGGEILNERGNLNDTTDENELFTILRETKKVVEVYAN